MGFECIEKHLKNMIVMKISCIKFVDIIGDYTNMLMTK